MIVELQRAHTPTEYGHEEACAVCGERFRVESVRAEVSTDHHETIGHACPACVEMLGRRNPERFPTREEYEAAVLRFPGPIWASDEEATAAEEQGAPYHEFLAARACLTAHEGSHIISEAMTTIAR